MSRGASKQARLDAIEALQSALESLESGYTLAGKRETNLHARIGWSQSSIKRALALLGAPVSKKGTQP